MLDGQEMPNGNSAMRRIERDRPPIRIDGNVEF
jgi:hypothetical protein